MSNDPLAAVLRLLRAQAFIEARLDPGLGAVHGLSLRELMFLLQLEHAPTQRLRRVDLAARLSVSQSTVTRMALPLEKLGLVRRDSDPRDARVKRTLALTKADLEKWIKDALGRKIVVSVSGPKKVIDEKKLSKLAPITWVPKEKLFGY